MGQLTLGRALRIGRVLVQLQVVAPRDTRARDQTRRSSNHVALPKQLATPPVRTKQGDELGLGVDPLAVDARATLAVTLDLGDHVLGNHADRTRGDEDDTRLGRHNLLTKEVHEVVMRSVVHNKRLAPFATVGTGLLSAIGDTGVEKEVVDGVLADLGEGLFGEGLDVAQVVELQGQDGERVGGAVKGEGVVGLLGALGVAGAEDDAVGLGLLEELADGFEALVVVSLSEARVGG